MDAFSPTDSHFRAELSEADSRIFELLDVWKAARGAALVPDRRDFDPMAVPHLLHFIWMYRFDPASGDFVCRLAGERINDTWGRSIRGRTLRQIVGEADHPTVFGRWQQIMAVPLVQYGAASERLSALEIHAAERLLLPLADEDGSRNTMLGISLYRITGNNDHRSALVPEDIQRIRCVDL